MKRMLASLSHLMSISAPVLSRAVNRQPIMMHEVLDREQPPTCLMPDTARRTSPGDIFRHITLEVDDPGLGTVTTSQKDSSRTKWKSAPGLIRDNAQNIRRLPMTPAAAKTAVPTLLAAEQTRSSASVPKATMTYLTVGDTAALRARRLR